MGCSAAAFGLARVPASACAIIECPGRTKSPISPVLVLMDRAHRDLSFDTWIDCLAVPGFTPVGPEFQWFWKINWSSPRAPGRSHQVGWHVIGKSSSRSTRICNKKITKWSLKTPASVQNRRALARAGLKMTICQAEWHLALLCAILQWRRVTGQRTPGQCPYQVWGIDWVTYLWLVKHVDWHFGIYRNQMDCQRPVIYAITISGSFQILDKE